MAAPIHHRVLITGSRGWTRFTAIRADLDRIAEGLPLGSTLTVVDGDCPEGADRHSRTWCERFTGYWATRGITVVRDRRPANWTRYRGAAGFIRNAEMVADGADECFAYACRCEDPKCKRTEVHDTHGTEHCADLAEKAGIPTTILRWEDL